MTITLDAVAASAQLGSRSLIRFDVDIDWREDHRFLKCRSNELALLSPS